jgi:hypothetical protein
MVHRARRHRRLVVITVRQDHLVRLFLSLVCYVAAALCFIRVFWLAARLAPERTVAPTPREFWTGWIPGEFTPAGARLRQRITVMCILGVVFLAAGFVV